MNTKIKITFINNPKLRLLRLQQILTMHKIFNNLGIARWKEIFDDNTYAINVIKNELLQLKEKVNISSNEIDQVINLTELLQNGEPFYIAKYDDMLYQLLLTKRIGKNNCILYELEIL